MIRGDDCEEIMKRSEINRIIGECKEFVEKLGFKLPPFMFFSPQDWEEKKEEYYEVKDNMLGWDITDFGSGDFTQAGLVMLVLRNGNMHDKKYTKPYAEKLLVTYENQLTTDSFSLVEDGGYY